MKAWFCIPSARAAAEANEVLRKWTAMGYGVAVWRDSGVDEPECNICLTGKYPGYAQAVNALAAFVLQHDPDCQWIIDGGDDTTPDADHSPDEIAAECEEHFKGTFGVMQPTGDRWADGSIDRIAGSAWMGREWCQRANQGTGPLWHEFAHMFVDDCLLHTAERLGVYWRRQDLTHMHHHFLRQANQAVPAHLVKWNSPQHWTEMQTIFNRLKQANFEPCMPIGRVA